MSYVKLQDVKDHFLRNAANEDFTNELKHEIEARLADVDAVGLAYSRPDVIQLIISIEKQKLRFLHGEISAMQLYSEVAVNSIDSKWSIPDLIF